MNCRIRHIHRGVIFFPLMLQLITASIFASGTGAAALMRGSLPLSEVPQQDEPQEEVVINNTSYSIPAPWIGKKIIAPDLAYSDFRKIPIEYTHKGSKIYLLAAAYMPLLELLQAAEKERIFLKVESAYRSEAYQKRIFMRMLAEGRIFADIVRYVAPPGYSQHVLGMAVDFFPSNWRFAETAAYIWLRENAPRFGFEETYSRFNSMKIPWESWHWNYTGEKTGNHAVSGQDNEAGQVELLR